MTDPKNICWTGGYLPLTLSVLLSTGSAVLFKQAALSAGGTTIGLFFNSWYLGGIVLLFFQSLTWISTLRHIPLSVSYPIMSLIFPLGLICGWFFFDEIVSRNNLIGTVFIMSGVVLVQRPKKRK